MTNPTIREENLVKTTIVPLYSAQGSTKPSGYIKTRYYKK